MVPERHALENLRVARGFKILMDEMDRMKQHYTELRKLSQILSIASIRSLASPLSHCDRGTTGIKKSPSCFRIS
jgi:hypothetical protein